MGIKLGKKKCIHDISEKTVMESSQLGAIKRNDRREGLRESEMYDTESELC
jgi:hypothetical protein